ncbi:MAG: sugar transferase, partial [Lachnospiraceae bacterium]|nr:sugar transferase [Lachnospiraceae bacterium]
MLYRQERVTIYSKHFRVHKFRTMVSNADQTGTAVTVGNDSRIMVQKTTLMFDTGVCRRKTKKGERFEYKKEFNTTAV